MSKPAGVRVSRGQQRRGSLISRNVRLGAITLSALAIVTYLVFVGLPISSERRLTVMTNAAGALRQGNFTQVRIAGVNVGSVKSIKPAKGHPGFSEVTLKLADSAPVIRKDATIKMRPRLFLEGNFFLDLHPGTPTSPPLDGAELGPSAFTSFVASDKVFSVFDIDGRKDFKTGLSGFGQALNSGGAQNLNEMLKVSPAMLADVVVVTKAALGERPGQMAELIRNSGKFIGSLNEHEAGLKAALSDGSTVFNTFAANQENLQRVITALDSTTENAMTSLASLNAAIPGARGLVRDLDSTVKQMPSALDKFVPAVKQVRSLTRSGDMQRLLAEVRPMARIIATKGDEFGLTLGKFGPEARCLTYRAVPILNSVVEDGPLTTGLPAYQELLSSMVGLSSAAQAFTGYGPKVRLLISMGNQLVTAGNNQGDKFTTRTQLPLLGVSPPKQETPPPLRPDVDCMSQELAKVQVKAAPIVGSRADVPVDTVKLNNAFDSLNENGTKLTNALNDLFSGKGNKQLQDTVTDLMGLQPDAGR